MEIHQRHLSEKIVKESKHYLLILITAFTFIQTDRSFAASTICPPNTANDPTINVISSNCLSTISWLQGSIIINSGVIMNNGAANIGLANSNVQSLFNYGEMFSDINFSATDNSTVQEFINNGIMHGNTLAAPGSFTNIAINHGSKISWIINNGEMEARYPILNFGDGSEIGIILNNNLIHNHPGVGFEGFAIENDGGGTISSLINSSNGIISGHYASFINQGRINVVSNYGLMEGTGGPGIINNSGGQTSNIENQGVIIGSSGIFNGDPIASSDTIINNITNAGIIHGNFDHGIDNNSGTTISYIQNFKEIIGNINGINNSGIIGTINNSGQYATITGSTNGINNTAGGLINSLVNSGSIYGDIYGIENAATSKITSIQNSGNVKGVNYGLHNEATGTITTLYNSGDIINTLGNEGIWNEGSINTLQNDIGATRSTGIQILRGNAPSHYEMNFSDSNYTSLYAQPGLSGSMSYGVIAGAPTVSQRPGNYAAVLVNVPSSNLTNTSGTFAARGRYTLCETAPGSGVWDMVIAGGCNKLSFSYANPTSPSQAQSVKAFSADSNWIGTGWTPFLGFYDPDVGNTYQALTANRNQVEGAMHQRYAVMNALMWYDCNRFDKHNVCISMQARETGMGTQASGAGVFNIAYRPHEKIRAGVYLDYQVGPGAAQANQMVTFGPYQGGVQSGFNNASFGAYVGFNDKSDGSGLVARASGGYNPGKVTISRNANLGFTEPGMGTAGLNAYYAFGYGGYGISIGERTIFTPYAGIRYTNVIRNSYSEAADLASVLFPFSYNAYYEQLLTGMTGGQMSGKLTDRLGYNIGLGAEIDFARNANAYSGSSAATGLQAFGIEHGGAWNGVRPNGLIGGFYELSPRERFVINGYAGQQAFTSRNYLTGLAGYQVAF